MATPSSRLVPAIPFIGTLALSLMAWAADTSAAGIDEFPPSPPGFASTATPPVSGCAAIQGPVPAQTDAATMHAYSFCAQQLAAESCQDNESAEVAGRLAARFSLPQTRIVKGLRRINSLHGTRKSWCELTRDDYASIVSYAATTRDGIAEHREEWIRFALGDENGVITPGGLARALEERRALLREPVHERFAVAPVQTIGALPPSPAGWTNLTGYIHPVGRINDLLIHPTSTGTMWAGADGGGVWKTTDAGASWQPVNDFLGSLSIASFAMRPGDPSTIYVATGAQFSHGGPLGAGVFKSTDSGATWSQIALTDPATYPDWQSTYKLAIHPGDSNTLLAATTGGAYQTTNGGGSWTKLFTGQVRNVAIHPANGNLRVIAMDDGTVRVTTDGAAYTSYTIVAVAAPAYTRIALAPSSQNVMYALVNNGGATQLYRSATGGSTWSAVTPPLNFFYDSSYLRYTGGLWVDPTNANRIAVVEGWGMVTADASVATPVWKELNSGWVDFHGIVSDPLFDGTSNRIVYFMDDGGLYKWNDVDAVDTISPTYLAPNGMTVTQVYSVSGRGGNVILGAQDVGPRAHRSDGTSTRWRFISNIANGFNIIGDGAATAADRTNPNVLYGSRQFLNLWRSTDGGVTATAICGPDLTDVTCSPPNFPSTGNTAFIAPFILDPNNPSRMLAGGTSLWRSNNVSSGTPPSWSAIHSGAAGVVVAIAVAPSDSNVVWVAYSGGSVYKTTNGTAGTPAWTQVVNVPAGNKLRIYIDRTDPNRVYIGLSGFSANRLRVTPDGGVTWNTVTGLPSASVFAIQQHPSIANWLYAGTTVGLFASEDSGATWSTTNYGPANVQVRDLSWYSESGASAELLVGTFGRGVWRAALNPGADAGAIQFRSNATNVTEGAAGGAVLSLTRSTGAGGAVSVTYNTANGTAIAGTDYTAVVNGTVSWADGDASIKTISIPVPDNGLVQADRAFTVTLSAPTGGAVLGTPTTATVAVTDPEQFPPQCQMPVGWFVPGTANAGWAVATDQVYERTCSLKSMPIGDGQAAEIAYTGNFAAGNITFRRKVSSELNYDFFKFYIDGAEQISARASGNTDWISPAAAFSFAVSAGTHTITFRYEKDADCCISGGDAAWIDAVTLPLAPDTQLTVTNGGNGTVTSAPAGINCGATCSALFVQGAVVTLTATPNSGYAMAGWSGTCTGTGTCTVTMNAAKSVTVAFASIADTSPPTVPGGLGVSAVSASQINLAWTAASDNVGVTAYRVLRGAVFRVTVNVPSVSYSDTGLTASTLYSYTVAACDAAGNCSAQSAAASATTLAAGAMSFTPVLAQSWNMVGNALNVTLNVATIFGGNPNIASVWKWDAAAQNWAYYSPALTPTQLQTFADNRGYLVLATIGPGEGYWVNAGNPVTLATQNGNAFNVDDVNFAALPSSWNMLATASSQSPHAFANTVSGSAAPGTGVNDSFLSLWAWDAALQTWYYYAPALENAPCGAVPKCGLQGVKTYVDARGLLHFEDAGKTLGNGVGFWVNRR